MFDLQSTICDITGANNCELGEVIQSLWSGYGVIQRVSLDLPGYLSAVVKHIDLSQSRENRRGWSGDASHQRKVRSYEIEKAFYESYADQCSTTESGSPFACRVPKLLGTFEKADGAGSLLVLEDLATDGYGLRQCKRGGSFKTDLDVCLRWLANFHATFLGCEPAGLWPVGTYWHLATRQEELDVMEESSLKQCADRIDQRLSSAKYQTLVHGDAKLANFCFRDESRVAAVDFQYVGGGCGMKDVAYLVSSCLDGSESESQQNAVLDVYFRQLEQAIIQRSSPGECQPVDFAELESEWRELYAFAWADFCRFLAGWSPGHWKMNQYNDRVTRGVVDAICGGNRP